MHKVLKGLVLKLSVSVLFGNFLEVGHQQLGLIHYTLSIFYSDYRRQDNFSATNCFSIV